MSCGQPHAIDCLSVLNEVYLYLDGELSGEQKVQVRQHLDECAPCLRQFGVEREVRALVARCCADPAPEGLRSKVMIRLDQVRVEIGLVEFRAE